VEIMDGVEGLVHISELAQHHVENPREIVNQGDVIRVKILEIDSERRRLSLSAKRVEDQVLPLEGSGAVAVAAEAAEGEDVPEGEQAPEGEAEQPAEGAGDLEEVRDLGLSEDVFAAQAEEIGDESAAGTGQSEDAPDAATGGNGAAAAEGEPAPEEQPEQTS
jgi:small subunit ribosomal protein S1